MTLLWNPRPNSSVGHRCLAHADAARGAPTHHASPSDRLQNLASASCGPLLPQDGLAEHHESSARCLTGAHNTMLHANLGTHNMTGPVLALHVHHAIANVVCPVCLWCGQIAVYPP